MTEPNLFDVDAPKRKAKKPVDPPAVQGLIRLYVELYEKKRGEPPVVLKKDGAALQRLVRTYGPAKVEQRLRAFMAWDDPFVTDSGYSLALLQGLWNRLAARVLESGPSGRYMNAEQTEAYRRSLKGPR